MEKTILIIVAALLVLTILMFLFLKKVVKEINAQLKKYFVLKLQDYDDLIEEREKKIQVIEKNVNKEIVNNSFNTKEKVICVTPKEIEFEIDDLIGKLKKIDESFKIDTKSVVLEFLKYKVDKENINLYNELINLKKSIEKYGIYKLITDNNNELSKIIKNSSLECQELMKKYFDITNDVNQFMIFLNREIARFDPNIYIEVGNNHENYNNLSPRIKTIYNKKIYKGIKIYYHSKLYNYCLE